MTIWNKMASDCETIEHIVIRHQCHVTMHSVTSIRVSVMLSKALTYDIHFGMQAYLQRIQVKFLYQGHQVKVKVTGAMKGVLCVVSFLQSETDESLQLLSYVRNVAYVTNQWSGNGLQCRTSWRSIKARVSVLRSGVVCL